MSATDADTASVRAPPLAATPTHRMNGTHHLTAVPAAQAAAVSDTGGLVRTSPQHATWRARPSNAIAHNHATVTASPREMSPMTTTTNHLVRGGKPQWWR